MLKRARDEGRGELDTDRRKPEDVLEWEHRGENAEIQ
jgi:hypothetical protein